MIQIQYVWKKEGGRVFLIDLLRQLLLDQALDALELLDVVLRDEGDGTPCAPRSRRTPDAMHVILSGRWQIVIQHNINRWNVKAATRNISRHKNIPLSGLELVEGAKALRLRHASRETDRGEAEVAECQRHTLRCVAGAAKNQSCLAGVFVNDIPETYMRRFIEKTLDLWEETSSVWIIESY